MLFLEQDGVFPHEVAQQLGDVEGFRLQLAAAVLELHEQGHLFDHLGHFLGFVLDDPTVILPVAGAGGDILPQPLGVGLDQGDGGLELVGDIGNEGAPRLVLPRFFFHIAG